MRIRYALLAVFFGCLSQAEAATLTESYQAALKRSEIVADQGELINQAEENYRQAIGSVLPQITGAASYTRQQIPAAAAGSPFVIGSQPLIQIHLDQPLFRGFREFAGLRLTSEQTDAQKQSRHQAELQLFSDTASAFFNVVTLERDLDNIDAELALYRKQISVLEGRVKTGRSRLSEVLTMKSSMGVLMATRESTKGQIAAARELYAFQTGLPRDTALQNGAIESDTPHEMDFYVGKIEQRPDIQQAKHALNAAEENITVARGAHWPSIDLIGDYFPYRYGPQSDVTWDVGVQLTVPIFMGGQLSSKVRQAVSQRTEAQLTLSKLRRMAADTIQSYFKVWESDRNQLDVLRDTTVVAEQNFEVETKEYGLGIVTNLDVLTALTSFEESRRALDRARTTVRLDGANLAAAVDMVPMR